MSWYFDKNINLNRKKCRILQKKRIELIERNVYLNKLIAKKYYIQVCNDITNLETRTRELRPFIALNDSILKILVVNKPLEETMDKNGFIIIGIADFLLRFIKQIFHICIF